MIDSLSSKDEIDKINETNHTLRTENIQLKVDLNKYKNDLNLIQNEFNKAISKQDEKEKTISEYKAKIECLEEKIEQLKTDMLNFAIGDNPQINNNNNNDIITPNEEFEEIKNEKNKIEEELEKYKSLNLILGKKRTFCFKLQKENMKLKEEIMNMKKMNLSNKNKKDYKKLQNSKTIDSSRRTTKPTDRKLLFGIKEKNSDSNITPDGNLTSSVNFNEYLENNKLIQFLREQNKINQSDIQSLTKGKNELIEKIKEIEKEKVNIKEQLISKEREVSKYRITVNRLKLKIKELSNNSNNNNL